MRKQTRAREKETEVIQVHGERERTMSFGQIGRRFNCSDSLKREIKEEWAKRNESKDVSEKRKSKEIEVTKCRATGSERRARL
jgi:hypothetical protein